MTEIVQTAVHLAADFSISGELGCDEERVWGSDVVRVWESDVVTAS